MVGRINLHNLFDIRDDILKKLLALLLLWGQEYQPGGVGIYLVIEYFERFWGVN